MRKIVLSLIKLIAVPVFLLLYLLSIVGRLAATFFAYAAGIPLLVLAGILLFCLSSRRWTDAAIIVGIAILLLAVLFASMLFAELVRGWTAGIKKFLRS